MPKLTTPPPREMARGLKLERNVLARPRNQAFTSAEHARAIRDAERTVYHPHTLSFDLSASCEELRREESVLEILEPAQNDTADTHAIASRKRTELLLRENVTPEEWLTRVAEAGFARPSLQQMQAQLRQTELLTQRMQAQLQKKRQHLVRHGEDIRDAHAAAARLREVCRCFQELRAMALRPLLARNEGESPPRATAVPIASPPLGLHIAVQRGTVLVVASSPRVCDPCFNGH